MGQPKGQDVGEVVNKYSTNSLKSEEDAAAKKGFDSFFRGKKWVIPKPNQAMMIAISARAIFDMRALSKIYDEQGPQAYEKHMMENEKKPIPRGTAFSFVLALHHVNLKLLELNPKEKCLFDIVLITNNSAQVGVTLINSINYYGLHIERACFTGGSSAAVGGYLEAYDTDLYLSTDAVEVEAAINKGVAAATIFTDVDGVETSDCNQLRIAFDGDAVLFSDEAEVIAKKHGLEKFFENEKEKAHLALDCGPLKRFAIVLGQVKKKFANSADCPIRIYLVTARGASSSALRVLHTLRSWGIDVDEALFLAGAPKGPILAKIKPHLFFDDSESNIDSGLAHGVYTSAHVPYGISQVIKTGGTAQMD